LSNWISLLLGAVLGAIPSWLITRWYYQKSSRDQAILFHKLSADVREAILRNPNDTLRHDELIEILEEVRNGPVDTSRLQGSIDGGTF